MKDQDPNRPLITTFSILAGLGILLLIVVVVVALVPKKSTPAGSYASNTADSSLFSAHQKKPLADLSKEEALAFLAQKTADYSPPSGLLNPKIEPLLEGQYVSLKYSYADEPTFDDGLVSQYGAYKTEIFPVEDSYAVFYALSDGKIVPNGYLDIVFNQADLNFRSAEVEKTASDGSVYTSREDTLTFVNTSKEFLEKSLPLVSIALYNKDFTNIYDYSFSEENGLYIFTTYNISAGFDASSDSADYQYDLANPSTSAPYAINLYSTSAYVDLNSGDFGWLRSDSNSIPTPVKSISVSYDEIEAYLSS